MLVIGVTDQTSNKVDLRSANRGNLPRDFIQMPSRSLNVTPLLSGFNEKKGGDGISFYFSVEHCSEPPWKGEYQTALNRRNGYLKLRSPVKGALTI